MMKSVDIEVVDNFLPTVYFEKLNQLITSENFLWSYKNDITNTLNDKSDVLNYGFNRIMMVNALGERHFDNTFEANFISPLIYSIQDYVNCAVVYRSRLDLTVSNGREHIHPPHIDLSFTNISSVFYCNDTDGDTIIYNETRDSFNPDKTHSDYSVKKRISPKPNRLLIFSGEYVHTGSSPVESKSRILLNSNFGDVLV